MTVTKKGQELASKLMPAIGYTTAGTNNAAITDERDEYDAYLISIMDAESPASRDNDEPVSASVPS